MALQTAPVKPGMYDGITNYAYHNGPGFSSSQLKVAVKKSMRHFWGEFIAPNPYPNPNATPNRNLDIGSAYHKAVLEPDEFFSEFIVPPVEWNLRKADHRKQRDDFIAANPNVTMVTQWELDEIHRMRDALLVSPEIRSIVEGAKCEQSIYWNDEDTNLGLKCRPDGRHQKWMLDLKSTADCSPGFFSRQVHNLGYHYSAAHYLDGDAIINGTDHETFILIAQEKTYPYVATAYPISERALFSAREELAIAKEKIQRAIDTDIWPDYVPQDIDIPHYARYVERDED